LSEPGLGATHKVVVVGAGIGGLVSALLLACRGHEVTLVEAADGPGGKMRPLVVDGQALDAGPTVFTMRWVFDEILARAGTTLEALVGVDRLSILARHAWRGRDGWLDLHASRDRSAAAIAAFAGPDEARRFERFCDEAARVYRELERPVIRSARPSLFPLIGDLGWRGLGTLAALGPLATLARALPRRLHDPRLQQLFARYATYCGASPWQAPATLMLVAHVEMEGVWAVRGGMRALAQSIAALALQRGARLRYGARVERIVAERGHAAGVELASGERLPADAVVFNGDVAALAQGLLGEPARAAVPARVARRPRSLSAVTWAMRAASSGMPLVRHNVFFDDDYAGEFEDIFVRRRLPRRGTVYLCAQDRLDGDPAQPASDGCERLLALVNAPPDGDRRSFDDAEIAPCESSSFALLDQCDTRLSIRRAHQVVRRTPADFHRLFPATGGALYGMATHGWTAVLRRLGATSALPGLYLAGGSVHPGPGVPMAAMSGALAAATMQASLDSTSRSRRVRISGGMSTPSATTAATR
jgi:1-hydroxycarotenoid 3,4-desaturase